MMLYIVYINPLQNIKSESVKVLNTSTYSPLYVVFDAGPCALRPGVLHLVTLPTYLRTTPDFVWMLQVSDVKQRATGFVS